MIWALFGLALLAYAYTRRGKDVGKELITWTSVAMGVIFLLFDLYVGLILPWQISSFWNGGYGISYNTTVQFNNWDQSVAFFMAQTKYEWLAMQWLQIAAILLAGIFILLFIWNTLRDSTADSLTGARK